MENPRDLIPWQEGERVMVETMNRPGRVSDEARQHSEGPVAHAIEQQTARLPSDLFLWAAGASILGSLALQFTGYKHESLFVGQWAPTFLLLGVYNKIVKVAGPDRVHARSF